MQHIDDVKQAMTFFAESLKHMGASHDNTKVDYKGISQFHDDFVSTQKNKDDFTKKKWYQRHIAEERHHLNERVPDDVDLLDVLEMIADIVMAGMARSGKVCPVELPSEVLQNAVKNTVDMLIRNTEVSDE